ncbi:phosphatase PAP2 family protein [Rhizobium sp. C1]|uniref:phosphatase PAP2 family protein n=1 Tax=Rhizobium sp. C1 TaxID=1349799 RepID=UPI001E37594C|nr:phosphatase PAP2 family protein [Rhizobium sp. C1]MCD2179798.1 phosphatase PAP2 family protein [Rhizobium sp. C1]
MMGLDGFLNWLAERRAQYSASTPPIRWKTWAAITVLLVVLAMVFRDSALTLAARHEPHWLRVLAENTTDIGKSWWSLTLTGIVFIAAILIIRYGDLAAAARVRLRYVATASAYVFLSVALSGIITNIVKRIIGRARPPLFDAEGAFHFKAFSGHLYESFPSGHSTTDGAMAMALAVLFPSIRIPILILGGFLALTRIMVGAHYLSDVIAGYSFGLWYAYMSALFFAKHGFSLKRPRW